MTDTLTPRAPRPTPGPAREYHFPRFERRVLDNGLSIVVAPVSRLPIVTVLAVIDGGAADDPQGREGLAQLAAKLLLEGAGDFDGAALAEQFERLGATIESSADWDAVILAMTVTTEQLTPALALFATVLRQPSFQPREVERLKAERQADILQLRAEPRGLADEAFAAAVYASASRYAIAEGGSEISVNAISRDDIVRHHGERYVPATTTLIVAGDISADALTKFATKHLGDWSGDVTTRAVRPDGNAPSSRVTHLIDKPDAAQAELRVGQVSVPRMNPDYFDLVVMNAILGGLFNSRINMNLREAHAYTYGAFSAFDWRRGPGPFVVSTAVNTPTIADAAREVLAEIDRIRADEVTNDELAHALSYLDGVFPIRYETTAAIANALATKVVFGLPDDYFDRYRERISKVSTASIRGAARRHLDPERLQLVVVGDATAIRESLTAMAFGSMNESR